MSNQSNIALWTGKDAIPMPKKAEVPTIINFGIQLSDKDKKQIISAYQSESYEMLGQFIWAKTIATLKNQLSKMGVTFIAELLDRTDISEDSNLQKEISEYEAIRLAEELGIINGTGAFRLKQAMNTIAHFNEINLDGQSDDEMTDDEIKSIVRSCIQGVLGYDRVEAAIDFRNFRNDLENEVLNDSNPHINKLVSSPYFFHRTTIRILLSIVKSTTGAKLETSLSNANLIIPQLWSSLKDPERYQVGRCYAELNSDGKISATKGMKSVLLKVKGFDYVPEDLRSNAFIAAADDILKAHEGFNNFYNEPSPVRHLLNMGNIIPAPAFSKCMTAILCVKLGNGYGVSSSAQAYVDKILNNVSEDRWVYYIGNCLEVDDRILLKLTQIYSLKRWLNLFSVDRFEDIISQVKNKDLILLLNHMMSGDEDKIRRQASKMYQSLGYWNQ